MLALKAPVITNWNKSLIFGSKLQHLQVENESNLINLLINGDENAFESIFKEYFPGLQAYASSFLHDADLAEEGVQNVFCRVWDRRRQLKTGGSIKSFLYRAVHNECQNILKHQKVRERFNVYYAGNREQSDETSSKTIIANQLKEQINDAMNQLPEQCRIVFHLSRFENLKYQQIADQMGLSVKTIENQMGKALKIMRQKLAEYLPLILILLIC